MDKIDEIQAKIRKQEEELWDLEDNYKAAKKEIEETYWKLEDNKRHLTRLYEEFEEATYHFSRQDYVDKEECRKFINLLDAYASETDREYRRQCAKIEEKDEKLTNQYRKDRRQLEEELEKSYQLRRKLDEEEGGNK